MEGGGLKRCKKKNGRPVSRRNERYQKVEPKKMCNCSVQTGAGTNLKKQTVEKLQNGEKTGKSKWGHEKKRGKTWTKKRPGERKQQKKKAVQKKQRKTGGM